MSHDCVKRHVCHVTYITYLRFGAPVAGLVLANACTCLFGERSYMLLYGHICCFETIDKRPVLSFRYEDVLFYSNHKVTYEMICCSRIISLPFILIISVLCSLSGCPVTFTTFTPIQLNFAHPNCFEADFVQTSKTPHRQTKLLSHISV